MKSPIDPHQSSLPLRDGESARKVVIQRSRIAGFRHHEAPLVWTALQPSVPVTMTHEPFNEHDPDAVARAEQTQGAARTLPDEPNAASHRGDLTPE